MEGTSVLLKITSDLFGNMLLVAQTLELDMHDVLKHPMGPLTLITADGALRKTNKLALAKYLQRVQFPLITSLPYWLILLGINGY